MQAQEDHLLIGDTAVLIVTGAKGTIQWQESTDSMSWTDISGATDSIYELLTTSSPSGKRFFRAQITNAICEESPLWYSSVIKHTIITHSDELQMGDFFHGGIVFYRDSLSGYVLIAAPADQGEFQWGCVGQAVGVTAQSATDGQSNTAAIVAFHDGLDNYYENPTQCNSDNDGTVAAKACDTLALNGYTDWYLPAKDELNSLYEQQNLVGGFSSSTYWISTESSSHFAWNQLFSLGYQDYNLKTIYYRVRCVRRD